MFQRDDSTDFVTPNQAASAHRRFIAKYQLAQHRFHDLRHTCATLLLKHGENVHVVAKQLGHASPTITLTTYAHLMPADEDVARAVLDAALEGHADQARTTDAVSGL